MAKRDGVAHIWIRRKAFWWRRGGCGKTMNVAYAKRIIWWIRYNYQTLGTRNNRIQQEDLL